MTGCLATACGAACAPWRPTRSIGAATASPRAARRCASWCAICWPSRALTCDQVLLTHGSNPAMDWVARRPVRPGDAVLVDEPGYPNLLFSLRFLGARLIGVPRTPGGWDLAALQARLTEHAPKVLFTQPRLQSPTGSVANLAQASARPAPAAGRGAADHRRAAAPVGFRAVRPARRRPVPLGASPGDRQRLDAGLPSRRARHPARPPDICSAWDLAPSPWLRFNVVFCNDEAWWEFLASATGTPRAVR